MRLSPQQFQFLFLSSLALKKKSLLGPLGFKFPSSQYYRFIRLLESLHLAFRFLHLRLPFFRRRIRGLPGSWVTPFMFLPKFLDSAVHNSTSHSRRLHVAFRAEKYVGDGMIHISKLDHFGRNIRCLRFAAYLTIDPARLASVG